MAADLEGGCACGAVRYRLGSPPMFVHIYVRSKLPWVTLPENVPAFEAYYDSRKLWPHESLERRRAIFGEAQATLK
jgi:hypothetical protein